MVYNGEVYRFSCIHELTLEAKNQHNDSYHENPPKNSPSENVAPTC